MATSSDIDIPTEPLAELCHRFQVEELAIFGSAARGEMRPDSDVDLLVEFEPHHGLGLFEFDELEQELTAIFGRKVDLVSRAA